MRRPLALLLLIASLTLPAQQPTQPALSSTEGLPVLSDGQRLKMDADLLDVTVARLHTLYAQHRYTVTEVVRWHLDRIRRYNDTYKPIQTIEAASALARAAQQDAEAKRPGFRPGPLWGVPIVTKANTSVRGLVTTDGWRGYMLPGKELVAPRDATIVARLRAAGAILLGVTNMPDFAASDTNRSTAFGRTGNAYDIRFSPGGSSGGTVTAVTSNLAVLGNGTDTGNSIRMPVATSNLVGIFPTRGLVPISGIAPLDWQLDNTAPIARTVEDAALALTVMASAAPVPVADPLDPRTAEAPAKAQPGPYTQYLKPGSLKGKRFGVPAFILDGVAPPFQGACHLTAEQFAKAMKESAVPLAPETREAFLKAVEQLRAAGAIVLIEPDILPDSFALAAAPICTLPYLREGHDAFLANFGPAQYHSAEEYRQATGSDLPAVIIGGGKPGEQTGMAGSPGIQQRHVAADPDAESTLLRPRREVLALYNAELDRLHLDGFVYPAIQMPPVDETMPQNGQITGGPHSNTSWVNMIGVPAISLPAGFYPDGLPFGIEISARPWHDGDLIAWGFDFEQHTHPRRPPVLIDHGLLPKAARPLQQ